MPGISQPLAAACLCLGASIFALVKIYFVMQSLRHGIELGF
jgi:hypothetical protein